MQNNPYIEYITFLTAAYNFFNEKLCKAEAPNIIMTVQTRGRKPANGWFWENTWKNKTGDLMPEVNICAERLDRPIEDLLETVIHELAHSLNNKRGVTDVTGNQFHNRKFKATAEELGLSVSKMPGKGYAITALTDKTKAVIAEFLTINTPPTNIISRVTKSGNGSNIKLYTISATPETKEWFIDNTPEEMSQKDFLTQIIDFYKEKTKATNTVSI